jgi:hypothetical protein
VIKKQRRRRVTEQDTFFFFSTWKCIAKNYAYVELQGKKKKIWRNHILAKMKSPSMFIKVFHRPVCLTCWWRMWWQHVSFSLLCFLKKKRHKYSKFFFQRSVTTIIRFSSCVVLSYNSLFYFFILSCCYFSSIITFKNLFREVKYLMATRTYFKYSNKKETK